MLRTIFDPYSDLFLEYIETSKKNDMQTNHYHDTYELFFVVKGVRYIFLDGVCHVLNPGDIILIKPYQTHYMQSLSSDFYARYVLNFAPDYLDEMLKPAEKQRFLEVLQNDILHLTPEQSGELAEVFERLRKYYNRHDAVAEKLKQNYCLELLLLCRDYYTRQERTQMPELSAAPRQEILDAIAYINAHYAEKIDLETIASQIHLSKYYFCRIFREMTGATVLEYLTNVRLTRAGRLLVESSLAIQEIAQKTGFASLVHFSRTYRNAYGVSPSDTRRRRKA
jgi:AraC-like DNA-binding protein